jgi:putative DNA primase/helicase
MVEPKEVKTDLMAAIEALKRVSPEEREAACLRLAEEYGQEAVAKARKLLRERGIGAEIARRAAGITAKLEAVEPAEVAPPTEEPEPAPERGEAEPKEEPRVDEKRRELNREQVRLNLSAPYDIARTFIRLAETREGKRRYAFIGKVEGESVKEPTLWRWKGDFKCWNGRCYEDVDDDQVRSEVYDFLDQAVELNGSAIKPKLKNVNEVIDGLEAGANLPVADIPCWIGLAGRPQPRGLLVCRNGLLELETGKLWDHDPRFFCPNSVDFDFDPRAPTPRWEQFLGEVWPGDEEAVATLQEFFGLWLTDETKYQKACALIGPPRSGKGTIGRVLKGLLGSTSYAAVSLQSLGSEFGMAHLIGKKLALVPDVKLDRRMNITVVMERLLTTIGEDEQAINRKNKPFWQGRLGIRWLILGNDIPKFRGTDEAGALAARMIMIGMNEDFYGREDFDLTEKLLAERAGILNWAMEGLRRLRDRGRFIQPASGMELIQKLRASTSTIGLFVDECCALGPKESVECDILWLAFCEWSERHEVAVTLSNNTFSGALHKVFPSVVTTRPRRDNEDKRPRFFSNIRLRQGWRERRWSA